MAHLSAQAPAGNGELVAEPPYAEWAGLLEANRAARETWPFEVAGVPVADFVELARAEAASEATGFSRRLGVHVDDLQPAYGPLVMTGHQPEIYHPGIWVKDFFLQRIADEVGALAIDAVVDSDAFDAVAIEAPCMRPQVSRCREFVALGGPDVTYAGTPALSSAEVDRFAALSLEMLTTLPAPSVARHFERFAAALRSASGDARNLAEMVTFARRRYEAEAATTYLELPVSVFAAGSAFRRFVVDIVSDPDRFAEAFNGCLSGFRERAGIRGAAQPFPDLERVDGVVEVPFWAVVDGRRHRLWAQRTPAGVSLRIGRDPAAELVLLPPEPGQAAAALVSGDFLVVPRAVTLTLYLRMFVADLFIHGVGGGRYDGVTDDVARAWYGVEPLRFAVASLTLYLPLGIHTVTDEEIEEVRATLHRLEHNPDQLLGGLRFDDPAERAAMEELARRKSGLVAAIAEPGADKKDLGRRIREVNEELSGLLEPLRRELGERLDTLVSEQKAADILSDRTYPFCFFSPLEVADKVG